MHGIVLYYLRKSVVHHARVASKDEKGLAPTRHGVDMMRRDEYQRSARVGMGSPFFTEDTPLVIPYYLGRWVGLQAVTANNEHF